MDGSADAPDRADTGDDACRSCGLAPSPAWDTGDGRVHLCPPCAVMHGIGCP